MGPRSGSRCHVADGRQSGDNNAWMMTATILVLMMILPGLALILRRAYALQEHALDDDADWRASTCLAMLIWVMWGYSTAFGPEGNA